MKRLIAFVFIASAFVQSELANGQTFFTRITTGPIVNEGRFSRGAGWADFDNDGNLDLFVANGFDNLLYQNNGDGTFTKITSGEIVNDNIGSYGISWGDYDNDNDLDLFVTNFSQSMNFLYQNNGDSTFTKITAGDIVNGGRSVGCGWGDYDNDGDLDLFVADDGGNNLLFQNNGNGTFTKIIDGDIVNDGGRSTGCSWGDYDNDGDLDLFVANFGANNFLYQNNGDGTFTKNTNSPIVNDGGNSQGGSWGDYDNDGDLDLFVANPGINFLYENNGDGSFAKITAGPVVTDFGNSFGSSWCDFDNDGDLDLFVVNADTNRSNFLYENDGSGNFIRITGDDIVSDMALFVASVWGDYDNDGDLDLFVANGDGNNFLYRNNGNSNNWINIKLVGTVSNASAIGAKVRVKANINGNSIWQMREISGQTGYLSQNSLNADFGLGDANVIDSLKIEWPSGTVQVLTNVVVNHTLTIIEQGAIYECYPDLASPALIFTRTEDDTVRGQEFRRYYFSITNWASFPEELFDLSQDLPPCVLNPNASRTWLDIYAADNSKIYGYCGLDSAYDLIELSFTLPLQEAPPDSFYITLTDRRCNIIYTSNFAPILESRINITSPNNGFKVIGDSVFVTGTVSSSGGAQPINKICTVNGISALVMQDQFSALVPLLAIGENLLIAICTITDGQGAILVRSDTVTVFRIEPLFCQVEIVSPTSGALVCDDSVEVQVAPSVTGGVNPILVDCSVNGVPTQNIAGLPTAVVPLSPGPNTLIAECTYLDSLAGDSVSTNFSTLGMIPDTSQIVVQGVVFEAGFFSGVNFVLFPISASDADGDGTIEIIVPASRRSAFETPAKISFPFDNFGEGPAEVRILASHSDSLRLEAIDTNGALIDSIVRQGTVGLEEHILSGGNIRRIDILGTGALISKLSYIGTSQIQSLVCRDTVTVTSGPDPIHDIVINEILYDPNYDDPGTERIEFKNVSNYTVDMSRWVLWMRRDTLNTVWVFPSGTTVAPGDLLVVHWMARGNGDNGNVFTGVAPDSDRFWGNNVASSDAMLMGGVGNGNDTPFALALLQGPVPRTDTALHDPCNMVDFVQIGGSVSDIENIARDASLWQGGDYLSFALQGYSYELVDNPVDTMLTTSADFFLQPSPSIGSNNRFALPPEKHLLISEVCVRPDNSEFVEIYNPSDSTINLHDYYLTDNVNGADDAAYTHLVQGAASLQIQAGDFFVQFPANAQIGPRQFQTIAFSASSFFARYNVKPTYEISDDDSAVTNMDTIKVGAGVLGLNDADEALVLLKWVKNDSSDLVQDIDYVVWGEPIIVNKPDFAPLQAIGEARETKSIAAVKAPAQGINKTGVGLDGLDRNNAKSYYNNETSVANQRPIANTAHANLKSWQRVNSVEAEEKLAGGNGISGHDETSENLAASFKEAAPTPNGQAVTGPLDGLAQNRSGTFGTILDNSLVDPRLKAKGFPNKLINPGEVVSIKIQLQNLNDKPTGAFFGILRPLDPIVTMIDSTANFPSIDGNGATGFSETPYVLNVDDVILPDSLRFNLILIQKFSPPTLGKPGGSSSLSAVSVRIIFIVMPAVNISFDIFYNLSVLRTSKPDSNLLRFGYTLIFAGPSEDYTATETQISVNEQSLDNTIFTKVLLDAPQELGDIDPSNPEISEEILFNLAPTFREDLPSLFDLLMSWFEPCTGCPTLPNVPPGMRPISGGATITSALLDSLVISGQIVYYQADNSGIKRPTSDANIFVKRPDSTLFTPPFSSTTAANKTNFSGFFSFKVGKNDTGTYKIYAARPANTVPAGAVTSLEDGGLALNLIATHPDATAKDAVFKQIAADVNRDSMITNLDVNGISNEIVPATCNPPILCGWTFVDALTPVTNGEFFRAQDTLMFKVKNYGKHVKFVGIVYGDVDGSAGNLLPSPPAGVIVASNRNHQLRSANKSGENMPQEFFLSQNYPNPFNPTTRIEYGLPREEQVRLQIFNIVGQLVYTCVDQSQKAGYYKVAWNGRDQNGRPAPAGVYLIRLQAGAYSQVRKLALIK